MHTVTPGPEGLRSITAPATLLGVGLGGLFDGIVLHQILQWHHLLTSTRGHSATTVRGLEVNTLADGLFHAFTVALLILGVFMLWERVRGGVARTWRSLLGWALFGWGVFNVVEGVIDHHLLRLHHVRPGPNEFVWDVGFLALGAVLMLLGWALARSDERRAGDNLRGGPSRNARAASS